YHRAFGCLGFLCMIKGIIRPVYFISRSLRSGMPTRYRSHFMFFYGSVSVSMAGYV
ncbi:hypothetical protein COCCADRAFT_86000, partial [Bipolaris zeicola 26-R-13]